MSHIIRVRNVNGAVSEGFWWLKLAGVDEDSRNGRVRVAPGPVITEYTNPIERVLFNPDRDANAVFHLLESLWMLAGRDEAAPLLPYNARMAEYTEATGRIHGAYGHRWRQAFGFDQILAIVQELRAKPSSRQCVLQMWDANRDLGVEGLKDRPCNTHVYFRIVHDAEFDRLDMTVCCRSNDALWGAYGANAVHFSILQELMARAIGVETGTYRQFSNNFHAYWSVDIAAKWLESPPAPMDRPYPPTIPLLQGSETIEDFLIDCRTIFKPQLEQVWLTHFFHRVAGPLKTVYDSRKAKARTWKVQLDYVVDCDWKQAFIEWAERRENVSE
jgi:thymidylate synthase